MTGLPFIKSPVVQAGGEIHFLGDFLVHKIHLISYHNEDNKRPKLMGLYQKNLCNFQQL
jgi:hypothetical protein